MILNGISKFYEYVDWIKEHQNPKTGAYRRPRNTIYRDRNEKYLSINEMTEEERKEHELGAWWNNKPKERAIIERYNEIPIEEIPVEYRDIVNTYRELNLGDARKRMDTICDYKNYIKWIEEHKDEETGEYKKPRLEIFKENKKLKINEMTQEEKEENRLARWWNVSSKERIIIKSYKEKQIEDIPEEHRDIVSQYRKFKFEENRRNKRYTFEEYIAWIQKHQNKETGEYIKPRFDIYENGVRLTKREMTENEIKEVRLRRGWEDSTEKTLIEKYQNISEEDFIKLPKEVRDIILICNKYGINPKCNILQNIKKCVRDNVGKNKETRLELEKLIMEFNKQEEIEK